MHELRPETLQDNDWKGWGRNRNAFTLSVNISLRRGHAETKKLLCTDTNELSSMMSYRR